MPCHLPVYDRLLRRQEKTRAKLRQRYAERARRLDATGQAALEASGIAICPSFRARYRTPILVLEVSQCGSATCGLNGSKALDSKGITTHQTRATLATSLLNNGAPAALVRQLLGHFSPESLRALCELQQRQHDPAPAAGMGGRAGHEQARHHPVAAGRCEIRTTPTQRRRGST